MTSEAGLGLQAVAYGADTFVAVGFAGRVAASTNGQTWTEVEDTGMGRITDVGWNGQQFWIMSADDFGIWTSPDGSTWTETNNTGHEHVTYGQGRYVGVSGDGARGWSTMLGGFISAGMGSAAYWDVGARP